MSNAGALATADVLGAKSQGEILLQNIFISPYQPRQCFDETGLKELAESIHANKLVQPIVVRVLDQSAGTFELIDGERRLRAHKILKRKTIPAVILEATNEEAQNLVLIANIQRENLNILEQAHCLNTLVRTFKGDSKVVAEKLGKSLAYVNDRLAILNLPKEIQNMLSEKKLTTAQAKVLLELDNEGDQLRFAQLTIKFGLNDKQLRGRLQNKLVQKTQSNTSGGGSESTRYNTLNIHLIHLHESLESFEFDMLRDIKKRDHLLKLVRIVARTLQNAEQKLATPIDKNNA